MTNAERVRELLRVVNRIADRDYQERVWLNAAGTEVDSWEETICQFFDDYQADLLLAEGNEALAITPLQYAKLVSFKEALDRYARRFPDVISNRVVLEDPEWTKIIEMAKEVRQVFPDSKR